MTERAQLRAFEELVRALSAIMFTENMEVIRQIARMLRELDAGTLDVDVSLVRLFRLMDDAAAAFSGAAALAITLGHGSTFGPEVDRFLRRQLTRRTAEMDVKTINSLIEIAVKSYNRANASGKASAGTFFRFATRQGVVSDIEIAELLARGLINRQSARESIKFLASALARQPEIIDVAALARYRSRAMTDLKRKLARNPRLTPALREAFLAKKRATLEDGKVMQITTRTGKIRTYKIDTYAEMVGRTEIANAQVEGEIDAGAQFGIKLFDVTDHNTTTAICEPHEGVTYTTARAGRLRRKYPYLYARNRPTYHTNCRHRIVARPFEENAA